MFRRRTRWSTSVEVDGAIVILGSPVGSLGTLKCIRHTGHSKTCPSHSFLVPSSSNSFEQDGHLKSKNPLNASPPPQNEKDTFNSYCYLSPLQFDSLPVLRKIIKHQPGQVHIRTAISDPT